VVRDLIGVIPPATRPRCIVAGAMAACLAAFAPAPARACWQCDGVACVVSATGARACFYGFGGCTAWGACGEGDGPGRESVGAMALQLTWLETEDPAAGPRLVRGVGRRAFGASATRAHRAATGGEGRPAPVVAAIAGFGEAFDVALRDAAGAGIALAWTAEGRGGRVAVRALDSGAAIVGEALGEADALVVPVRHDGRAFALVIQPRVLPRLSVRLESEDLARAARDAVRPGGTRLAIEVAAAPR